MGQILDSLKSSISELFDWTRIGGQRNVRILILGLDGAGKTTMLYRLKHGEKRLTIPTIGFNFESIEIDNIKFHYWDIGGDKRIIGLWKYHYLHKDAIVFVIDSQDHERMDEAWEALRNVYDCDEVQGKFCLIFMNKRDSPNRISSVDFVERFKLTQYFRSSENWFIIDCCAMNGKGIFDGFRLLSNALRARRQPQPYHHHFKGMNSIRKIYAYGWTPSTHKLFPRIFRQYVWIMVLISDRLGMSVDSMKIVLSFIEITFDDFQEMGKISGKYVKNIDVYNSIPIVRRVLLLE